MVAPTDSWNWGEWDWKSTDERSPFLRVVVPTDSWNWLEWGLKEYRWKGSFLESGGPYWQLKLTWMGTERVQMKGVLSWEWWPLLTVETEVNWDYKSTNERGPFLVGSLVLSCWYKRFLFCPGCSSRPSTKYFFLTAHFFNSFVPHCPVSWAGSRAGSPVS